MSGDRLLIRLDERALHCTVAGNSLSLPVGVRHLARSISGDPPSPADLTNAIGLVADHLDDLDREMPETLLAGEVRLSGLGIDVLADVELGARATLPVTLSRAAAEDVFRTLATESARDRAINPGLPAEWVHDILGTCCAVVALMRHLSLDTVTLDSATAGHLSADDGRSP